MEMRVLHQDYETYFGPATWYDGTKISLSLNNQKLAMTDYVRHPEFEVHGVALGWDDAPREAWKFHRQDEIANIYKGIDWENTHVVAHHAWFEGIINHEIYDVHPGRYSCTMAMADAIFQGTYPRSLDGLMRVLLKSQKLPELHKFRGLHTDELTPEQWQALGRYAINDIVGSAGIYHKLVALLPQREWNLMDISVKMFANPRLHINADLAKEAYEDAVNERREAIEATGHTEEEISGNLSFAELLRAELGYVPTKKSPTDPSKDIPAFARDDQEWVTLKAHASPRVRSLVRARQAVRSNIGVTRAERMYRTATTGRRDFPVCVYYAKAHTMRWAGGNKMNPQNFVSGGKLRRSIEAPPGYVLVIVDSSQIECRWEMTIAKQEDMLEIFQTGGDPYAHTASDVYGFPVSKEENPDERFMGKTITLALGFGMGAPKFHNDVVTGARGKPMDITMDFANHAVKTYRESNHMVPKLWEAFESDMKRLARSKHDTWTTHDGLLEWDAASNRVIFPNGCWLRYPNLGFDEDGSLMYQTLTGKNWKPHYLWGGTITENFVQALARHTVAPQLLKGAQRWPLAMTTHDEGAFVVPENEADEALEYLIEVFRIPEPWMPDTLPLDAEGGYDYCYSK